MTGHDFEGPHWEFDLIGPDGRMSRLHKGGKQPMPKPAPIARQPLDDPARAAREERRNAASRKGYGRSVLADFAPDEEEKKTVLG